MYKSKTKYNHTLATYPTKWKKYVVSPKKICIQFDTVQCKTRAPDSTDLKKTDWGTKEMPIDTHGTDIDTLAVGIPLHLYPELIKHVLSAIKEHDSIHSENSILHEVKDVIKSSDLL